MGTLRIISRSSAPFRDRTHAGAELGKELKELRGRRAVILGIPRGGVVVARALAESLGDAQLDIMLSRKLRAPGNPELAIGAVGETGEVYINEELRGYLSLGQNYLQKEKEFQLSEIARRAALFRKVRPKVPLDGRIVLLTDDGVATGSTMHAAMWAARKEKPDRLIVALPVGPEDTLQRFARDADEVICLRAPLAFAAVSQFYEIFDQTEDNEITAILQAEAGKAGEPHGP